MTAHGIQERLRCRGVDDGNEFPFVGNVKWVQTQHLAGSAHFFTNGNAALVEGHPHTGSRGNLVERAGQPAAGRVSHAANALGRLQHLGDERMQRSAVTLDRVFKLQAFAYSEDGNPVFANGTAEQDAVARSGTIGGQAQTWIDRTNSGGVDEHPVAASLLHDFGITGDYFDLRTLSRVPERLDNS